MKFDGHMVRVSVELETFSRIESVGESKVVKDGRANPYRPGRPPVIARCVNQSWRENCPLSACHTLTLQVRIGLLPATCCRSRFARPHRASEARAEGPLCAAPCREPQSDSWTFQCLARVKAISPFARENAPAVRVQRKGVGVPNRRRPRRPSNMATKFSRPFFCFGRCFPQCLSRASAARTPIRAPKQYRPSS